MELGLADKDIWNIEIDLEINCYDSDKNYH